MGIVQTKVKQAKFQVKLKNKESKERIHEKKSPETTSLISSSSFTSTISSSLSVKFPSTNNDIDFIHQHHFVIKSIWSTNFSSPINEILNDGGAKILDVLCAAGTFLLELSNEYQNSEFVGVDKTRLFPSEIKPKNLNFIHANLLNGLPLEDDHFDFTHLNILETIYTVNDWDYIVKELTRVTKPGGYIEIQGFDFLDVDIGPKFMDIIGYYTLLFEVTEFDVRPRNSIRSVFTTNFGTPCEDDRTVLIGKRGGDMGTLFEEHVTMFFKDTIGEMMAQVMNINMDEYDERWNEVLREFSEFDTIINCYRIWTIKKDYN